MCTSACVYPQTKNYFNIKCFSGVGFKQEMLKGQWLGVSGGKRSLKTGGEL